MNAPGVLGYAAVASAAAAVASGLVGSYEGAVAALLAMGLVLALRSAVAASTVRQWFRTERRARGNMGPVSSMAERIQSARRGSTFSQALISDVLAASGGATHPPPEGLSPSESGPRLKGRKYMSELAKAVGVLGDS